MATPQLFAEKLPNAPQLRSSASGLSDALFRRVTAASDYPAFRQLFSLHYAPLCQYATRYVRCAHVAEEIVADVFMKLWRNRMQIEIYASFQPYCYRAVKNQALDYLKSRMRHENAHCELTDDHHTPTGPNESPDQGIINHEFDACFNRAIAQLPRQGQLIYRLSREQGLKYRDIAGQLGISVRTVEAHMNRSLHVLRDSLAGYY
ncbi:RNA polymerase sigma-70 factor [Fibrella sp. HMF5335]|uniref:RNA polymerase sigma-70 factor n=1 Tax=Fibrella rubiginis TaxID=2817060 RepID=A0A939K6G5_9BACT|nr:RNA polymerase sigma-70 factor [Fibrella rubiginis]MBO0938306.1 RNA polymerase sigma-70 factor [Fibrella rubiginis]